MDTVQHIAWAAPITQGINLLIPLGEWFWPIMIILGFFGALPDLIGWLEKIYYKDHSRWNWYLWAHNYPWYLSLVPTYTLHLLLDSFTHDEGSRWWIPGEGLHYEIISWLILITLALTLFLI